MQTSHPNHCITPLPGVCIRMHVARNFADWRFFGFSWNLFVVGRVSLFLLKVILFKFSEAAFNRLNFHSLLFKYKEYQYE